MDRQPTSKFVRASLALRLLEYEDARSRFARALELGADTVRVHFGYAQALDETGGNRQDVWRHLSRALHLDGGFPEALLFAGMLHNRELRYGDAVAPLERASRARPRWSPIWRALAFAYQHAHQPAEAGRAIGLALRTAQTPHQRREAEVDFDDDEPQGLLRPIVRDYSSRVIVT